MPKDSYESKWEGVENVHSFFVQKAQRKDQLAHFFLTRTKELLAIKERGNINDQRFFEMTLKINAELAKNFGAEVTITEG